MNDATNIAQAAIEIEIDRIELDVTKNQIGAMAQYVALLARWGQRIRVSGTSNPEELVTRHLVDSMWLAKLIGNCQNLRAVDVGSGAGLPGIPLAILRPNIDLVLCEPNSKRVSLLVTAKADLGLPVAIHPDRVETLRSHSFDWCWSRATWPPIEWLERGLRLVRENGQIGLFLVKSDLLEALDHTEGAQRDQRLSYTLQDGTPRMLVSYRNRKKSAHGGK